MTAPATELTEGRIIDLAQPHNLGRWPSDFIDFARAIESEVRALAAAPTEPPELSMSMFASKEDLLAHSLQSPRESLPLANVRTQLKCSACNGVGSTGPLGACTVCGGFGLAAAPATLTPAEPVAFMVRGNPEHALDFPFSLLAVDEAEACRKRWADAGFPNVRVIPLYAAPLVHSRVPLVESPERVERIMALVDDYTDHFADCTATERTTPTLADGFALKAEKGRIRAALAESLPVAGSVREGSGHSVESSSPSAAALGQPFRCIACGRSAPISKAAAACAANAVWPTQMTTLTCECGGTTFEGKSS